jgi:hypothetical protein
MGPVSRSDVVQPTRRTHRAGVGLAADLVAVLIFAAIGRRAHAEGSAVLGALATAAPFLAGTGAGWLAVRSARRGSARDGWSTGSGVLVVALTVAVGMGLRHLTGRGTPPSFVIVATTFLGLVLLGWRAAARGWLARRDRS